MRVQLEVIKGRGLPQAMEVSAQSVVAARDWAQSQGYTVLAVRGSRTVDRLLAMLFTGDGSSGLRRAQVNVMIEQLDTLLRAGLSVIEALDALAQSPHRQGRSLVQRIRQRLASGLSLSLALQAESTVPRLLSALIATAELTSDLPSALARYLEHERRSSQVREQLKSVAVYPLLLTVVGTAVLGFLLLYVMPRFARIFEGMHIGLPWSARAMVWWSAMLRDHAGLLLAAAAAVFALLAHGIISRRNRAGWLVRVAGWGPVRHYIRAHFLARWYRSSALLVSGGIALPQAIAMSADLLPAHMREMAGSVTVGLRQGLSPVAAFRAAGMVTPVADQLLLAGERSGNMASMLDSAANFHELEVARALDRAMRVAEPVFMTLIGLAVGAIVVLMYLPIFELASAIQ